LGIKLLFVKLEVIRVVEKGGRKGMTIKQGGKRRERYEEGKGKTSSKNK
jgi:hypothetical protein